MTSVCNFSRVFQIVAVAAGGWLAAAGVANLHAQVPAAPSQPAVTVSASSTITVQNDRLQAWLRSEAEGANPAAVASQVNTAIAKALASAKAYPAVKVATAGYSTQQVPDKQKPNRWRVVQTLSLDSGDFTAAATLISRLQDDDGTLRREQSAERVVRVIDPAPGQRVRRPRPAGAGGGDLAVRLREPLQLVRGHRRRHFDEIVFGLRGGDPGERPDLRVRQTPRGEFGGDGGQR